MNKDINDLKWIRAKKGENGIVNFIFSLSEEFGFTAANLMRRVLISNIVSPCIIGFKISSSVENEFENKNFKFFKKYDSPASGIVQLPISISISLSDLVFKSSNLVENDKIYELNFNFDNSKETKEREILANELNSDLFSVVREKGLEIMRISAGAKVNLTLFILKTRGFYTEDQNRKRFNDNDSENIIFLDSNHSNSELLNPFVKYLEKDSRIGSSLKIEEIDNFEEGKKEKEINFGIKVLDNSYDHKEIFREVILRIRNLFDKIYEESKDIDIKDDKD